MAWVPHPYSRYRPEHDKRDNFGGTSTQSSAWATNQTNQVFGVKYGSNSTEAWRGNNTGQVENLEQDWSAPTVHSTPTISCLKQGNLSGPSVPSSTMATNQSIKQVKYHGEKSGQYIIGTRKNKVKLTEFPSNAKNVIPAQCQLNGQNTKRKFRKLITHGISEEEASKLCSMPWPDILKKYPSMFELVPEKKRKRLALHLPIPPEKIPKLTSETENSQHSFSKKDALGSSEICRVPVTSPVAINGQQSLGFLNTAPLRVGIRNKEPMTPDQMKMVHRHLLLAITKQFTGGGGPEFLSFTPKQGWIQITCVDQRSKDWLADVVQYLEPWPGMLLSVIPEEQLPNPPKVVTMIPGSEAASVQEALDLLKAQNKGLNTGHWQVLHERVEKDKSRTVTFIIDEKSFETLKAQELQAALGFKIVTFRIKDCGSQLIRLPPTQHHNHVTPSGRTIPENPEELGQTYAKNSVETDRNKHSSIRAKTKGIVDLTVRDQDGFAALAAAERVTSQGRHGFGGKNIQYKEVIDLTENYEDEISSKNQSKAKGLTSQPRFGSKPTIQNTLKPGWEVTVGQGIKEVNQSLVSQFSDRDYEFSQDKNGAHLTDNRDGTPSPEHGGYSSWIIQDIHQDFLDKTFFNSEGTPQFTGDYAPGNIQEPTKASRADHGASGCRRPSKGSSHKSDRLSPYNQLPKYYRLPDRDSRTDTGIDRDRSSPNRLSSRRRNSQDLQKSVRPPYSQDTQDRGRRDKVRSWENSSRGHRRLRDG